MVSWIIISAEIVRLMSREYGDGWNKKDTDDGGHKGDKEKP